MARQIPVRTRPGPGAVEEVSPDLERPSTPRSRLRGDPGCGRPAPGPSPTPRNVSISRGLRVCAPRVRIGRKWLSALVDQTQHLGEPGGGEPLGPTPNAPTLSGSFARKRAGRRDTDPDLGRRWPAHASLRAPFGASAGDGTFELSPIGAVAGEWPLSTSSGRSTKPPGPRP